MPLPLPDLPAGAISITFQANIPDYPATVRVLAPRITAKLTQFVATAMHIENGVVVTGRFCAGGGNPGTAVFKAQGAKR